MRCDAMLNSARKSNNAVGISAELQNARRRALCQFQSFGWASRFRFLLLSIVDVVITGHTPLHLHSLTAFTLSHTRVNRRLDSPNYISACCPRRLQVWISDR